ncbi:MAG: iron ABC transporter permease [Planctomycetes bacterium]|nr:iron ABC transporter permease [Planctomycetota bacterium]
MTFARRLADLLHRLPVVLALLFLALFALLPLGVLAWQTIAGPDGLTLQAWRELPADEHLLTRMFASLRLGLAATVISLLLGGGHTWLCLGRELPGARLLLPLGVAPLVLPPIFVAMGFADLGDMSGFWPCAWLLGICHAPFVAVQAARGLRAIDGRAYEAAWLLRGRVRAELWLLRAILPELLAGCLLAFLFTVADHGVPEFLTVKGKTWHTYAEGIFARWNRRAVGTTFADLQSPIVAALPFIGALGLLLWAALRLRGKAPDRGVARPLPIRPLGVWRWPALLLPLGYLAAGVGVPLYVLACWTAGSAQKAEPMSLRFVQRSFAKAIDQCLPDLLHSLWLAIGVALVVLLLAVPLARTAARRRPGLELLCALPAAVPAILLGIGLVRAFFDAAPLRALGGDFYAGWGFAVCGYGARFLPFAALTLAAQVRRQPVAAEEAAALVQRSATARALRIHLPPLLPAMWSAAVLVFVLALRELDLAVVLPAANATAVRRLANAVHFQHEDYSGVIALLLLLAAVLVPLIPSLLAGRRLRSLS